MTEPLPSEPAEATAPPTDVHRVPLAEGCDFPDEATEPAITLLLDAYRRRSAKADPESSGWVGRVGDVEGLDAEELSAVHGMAIAADLLEIRVEDAQSGLRYRARRAA